MSDYIRNKRVEDGEDGFFCRFTFGQFFALLVLEVFTLFFVFYLGARYGREFLGIANTGPMIVGDVPEAAEQGQEVMKTSDPQVAEMADDLISKAKTPELKDRIKQMI